MTTDHSEPLVSVQNLVKVYGGRGGHVAVDNVSFSIPAGRTFGLVGESGSGKSTIARAVLRLIEATSGTITIAGTDIRSLSARRLRQARNTMQMVFQDPYSSLNPRIRVGHTIREAMRIARTLPAGDIEARLSELFEQVGLRPDLAHRFPHELSGGQRQRAAIARAISVSPALIVLDEPTSALDVSVQESVLRLLTDLQARHRTSYLFISHDIAVVQAMADQVGVMHRGQLVEVGDTDQVLTRPVHPYTQQLLSAVPQLPHELIPGA